MGLAAIARAITAIETNSSIRKSRSTQSLPRFRGPYVRNKWSRKFGAVNRETREDRR
jgi:hypothetical protein